MTTNKTPIQELIEQFKQMREDGDSDMRSVIYWAREQLQKEKAFAFDCFEAGRSYQDGEVRYSLTRLNHSNPSFYEFYSQYTEKHNE